jgi:Terminase large subunit, T4likevirus-type, N-terminal
MIEQRVRLRRCQLTILNAMADRNLFARFFCNGESWRAWRVFLAALFALRMSAEQLELYRQCTGRSQPPQAACTEARLVIGRRGGKSFILALVAVFLACFKDWRPYLGPGERGTVMVIAADRKQARVIMRYVKGLLSSVPMLALTVESESRERIDLKNRVTIEVHSASFRRTRGYAIVAALLDEVAFWPTDDAAEPDYEIINAIRPGMATIPGAMLLCASSPYARRGALWDAYRRHFGKENDPILVWQAPTRMMNPTVPRSVIAEAMERDPSSAQAEYDAQFRSDIESFVNREAVQACISIGVYERPPVTDVRYSAFVDPSGGQGDSMTLAVGHRQGDVAVLDAIREIKPPFSPEAVVDEFAELLKRYRITRIEGDRYAGEWPWEQFKKRNITYELAKKPKSALYVDFLPVLNSRQADLLDHPRLIAQIIGLERRTARGGRDSIDHAPGARDDIANAVAGLVNRLVGRRGYDTSLDWIAGPDYGRDPKATAEAQARWRASQYWSRVLPPGYW